MPNGQEPVAPGALPQAAAKPVRGAEEERFDEIIFRRDLYEVHLLIDFISGRTDKTLDDLEVARSASEKLRGFEVVEAITAIRYPPDPPPAKSANAAFLLGAKNSLNMLAQPARGLTVAFTAMFVGLGYERYPAPLDSLRYRFGCMVRAPLDWLIARLTLASAVAPARGADDDFAALAHSRVGLARNAFPGLVSPVRRLRWTLTGLMVFFIAIWLPATAITYWDVSFLKATLQPLEQAARDRVSLTQANPQFDDSKCPAASTVVVSRDAACKRIQDIRDREVAARAELAQFLGCRDWLACQLYHPIRWRGVLFLSAAPAAATPDGPGREHYAAALGGVFGNYVLPMMFGLLGAGVRMLRVVQYKLRDSLLGPRDLVLTLIGLLIGAIAGVAVGLYLAPADMSLGGSAGNLTLTASGLGFLAGYGSDHFLKMLDSLLDRIFVADPAPEAAKAAADAKPSAAVPVVPGNVRGGGV